MQKPRPKSPTVLSLSLSLLPHISPLKCVEEEEQKPSKTMNSYIKSTRSAPTVGSQSTGIVSFLQAFSDPRAAPWLGMKHTEPMTNKIPPSS